MVFYFTPQQLASLDWYYEFGKDNTILWRDPWNHILPWGSVFLYIIMLIVLPKIAPKGNKLVANVIFPLWNLFLWIISVIMFVGALFGMYDVLIWLQAKTDYPVGIYDLLCDKRVVIGPHFLGFWTYIFALSKYVELFDTFWIILKNPEKPVELLHWWHHISVLLFTWYATMALFGAGLFFLTLNSLIHSFMYLYYFLMSIGYRPTWAKALTIGQITQMILGTMINVYWTYLYFNGVECSCASPNLLLTACGIVYGSYLWLFLSFYFKRYTPRPKKD